jgi:hypothetical protein
MERIAFLVDRTGERIDCMLNPETFELRRLAGVRPRVTGSGQLIGAGLSDDPLLFTGGGRTELTLDLVFDVDLIDARTAPEDVRDLTRALWQLAENTAQELGGVRPPLVRLVWGKTWNVPAVIVAVAERFDSFDSTGVPRRSWLRVKLVRVADTPAYEPSGFSGGGADTAADRLPSAGGVGAVQAVGDGGAEADFTGVRMDLLAAQALGSPTGWRRLAEHNDIDNPLAVPPGAVLAVPGGGQP